MSHFKVNERDIYFILKEQLGYEQPLQTRQVP